jgi:nicotinamidase-related amidase
MEDFPIIAGKTGMLFFDTLNGYLHPTDRSAQAAIEASGAIPAMVRISRACREAGIAIFYAEADHRPDGRDFSPHIVDQGYDARPEGGPYQTTPSPVMMGSWEAEIIPELAPQAGDYVIRKHRWSTFYQTHFELSLRTAGIDTLMLAGGSTEVGLASTAYAARDLDFNLIILRDACRSARDRANHELFVDRIFPIFARVRTVDEAIALFQPS